MTTVIPSKYDRQRPQFSGLKGPLETFTLNTVAASGFTNFPAIIDYPGPVEKNFIKRDTSTGMLASGFIGSFKAVNVGFSEYYLRINGVDHFLTSFFWNAMNTHMAVPFVIPVAIGLTAGTYTARFRWNSSNQSINADANDRCQLKLEEGYFA